MGGATHFLNQITNHGTTFITDPSILSHDNGEGMHIINHGTLVIGLPPSAAKGSGSRFDNFVDAFRGFDVGSAGGGTAKAKDEDLNNAGGGGVANG